MRCNANASIDWLDGADKDQMSAKRRHSSMRHPIWSVRSVSRKKGMQPMSPTWTLDRFSEREAGKCRRPESPQSIHASCFLPSFQSVILPEDVY